ncbi:MAG: lysine biosynthesis protein LysW [Candidatus Bathyarchaeia archaeon]|jgi:lysine biosynthesis protein LysW
MKNQTLQASMLFTCPQCSANFEFDAIGQNEFVPCPVCGTELLTVKVGSKLMLEAIEQALC